MQQKIDENQPFKCHYFINLDHKSKIPFVFDIVMLKV